MRVVHIAPGPTPTFTMSAPASISSRVPTAVTTLPATIGVVGQAARTASTTSSIFAWCPWAVSITSTSTPIRTSSVARPTGSALMPTATDTSRRPCASTAGR